MPESGNERRLFLILLPYPPRFLISKNNDAIGRGYCMNR
ncbi:FIG00554172: hypothetical protein [Cronobacter universalis NCTC 9529]|nr:FIG00554172: hypothetical protein [Cronobacter universalis NCTC 9529]CCK18034.1 FIG00554172: hypothetical protein [Cronobacter universalis NCTC 9529]